MSLLDPLGCFDCIDPVSSFDHVGPMGLHSSCCRPLHPGNLGKFSEGVPLCRHLLLRLTHPQDGGGGDLRVDNEEGNVDVGVMIGVRTMYLRKPI